MNIARLPMPRSALHGITPIGLGSSEVESLTSYFCRLANSHSCSTHDLTQYTLDQIDPGRWATFQNPEQKCRFVWHERSISGLGEAALTWASALSVLTGVPSLSQLTMLPMKGLLAPKGLMAKQARWCTHCLHDDLESHGRTPYFRLAWDLGQNTVCAIHRIPLNARCPHCERSNVRHTASYVIPGWCSACGGFLGSPEHHGSVPENHLQVMAYMYATQIGRLLASSSANTCSEPFEPDLVAFHDALEQLVCRLDGGVSSRFARRVGVRKSTVHYWRNSQNPVTLDALCRIAVAAEVSTSSLVQGKLDQWSPPVELQQMTLDLEMPRRYRSRRQYDWPTIRQELLSNLVFSRSVRQPSGWLFLLPRYHL